MNTKPQNAAVWVEIPVSDLARAKAFYASVTGFALKDEQMGPNMTAVFGYQEGAGVSGHLFEGKPSPRGTGPVVSLAIAGSAEEAIERVQTAGGEVVSPVFEIPFGRFAYCLDMDGNSFSVFEPAR